MWCTAASWKRVAGILAARGYDCFVPSLLAYDDPTDQPLKVRSLGLRDDVVALEQLNAANRFIRQPILLGPPMGALLAQQLATRLPPLAMVLPPPATPRGLTEIGRASGRDTGRQHG